jgi:tripartite-type tricarboxylate transporter receptor subunit TctC
MTVECAKQRGVIVTSCRLAVAAMFAALFYPAASLAAMAQTYPTRVIHLIVPFPPGGPTDVVARIVANSISPILGQSVVVESRPGGAGGTVGGKFVASADPDGYTLLISQVGALTITPSLYKLDYDPLNDFAPVAIIAQSPQILTVNPAVPANSVAEFLAYAKNNPGKVNFASAGVGTQPHLLGELLQLVGNVKLVHVPYRGSAPGIIDLLGGQVQMMFDSPAVMLPHIDAGKLRALAVTSDSRLAQLPNVPTMIEAGYPQLTATLWTGLVAPAGTPQPIVQKLNAAINQGLQGSDAQQAFQKLGVAAKAVMPREFSAFMAAETHKWAQVVAQAGIKGE